MNHKEKLIEMGIWHVFAIAFNKYSSIRESGIHAFLDDMEDRSLPEIIRSFATWNDTDEGYDFWLGHAIEAEKYREKNIDIEKIIKEM